MVEKTGGFFAKGIEIWREMQRKPIILWLLAGLIGMGIVLVTSCSDSENRKQSDNTNPTTLTDSTALKPQNEAEALEATLRGTLEKIAGAGEVQVAIHLKSENRHVWERQSRIDKRVSQENGGVSTEENNNDELVIGKDREGRDSPILKEDLAPEIQGVVIVASGAGDSHIRQLLTNTVITVLGLPAHRVLVIPGASQKEPLP